MPLVDIRVPQLGEGLQEALVVALLKAAGSHVDRDEPVFEMETDKARVAVEAVCAGRVQEWLVREGDVVPIGAVIGRIDADEVASLGIASAPQRAAADASIGGQARVAIEREGAAVRIPPRTRAHGRALGISEEELRRIPAPSGKLLPEDVDRYLAKRSSAVTQSMIPYQERRLSARQRILVYRFRQSGLHVIPATITGLLDGASLDRALHATRVEYPDTPVGLLEILAYGTAHAAATYPNFRSVLVDDDRVHEYPNVTLGIAVHQPGGELVTAIVQAADTLTLPDFARAAQANIAAALAGQDQSNESTQVILTYLGEGRIVQAVPTLVRPAIATLFVGTWPDGRAGAAGCAATLSLTFDHRLINGIEAAGFLASIADEVERLGRAGTAPGATSHEAPQLTSRGSEELAALRAASLDGRIVRLDALLRDRVAELLGVTSGAPDFRRPLRSLGLTSVMAVALCSGLARDLGIPVPATLVWNYPTIAAIVGHLARRLDGPGQTETSPASGVEDGAELARLLAEVEDLSDAEARRQLTEDGEEGEGR